MELIENLLQLLVTFVGALLSGIAYRKSHRQAYFLLLCFYGCFALGALYWTLYLLLDVYKRQAICFGTGYMDKAVFRNTASSKSAEHIAPRFSFYSIS